MSEEIFDILRIYRECKNWSESYNLLSSINPELLSTNDLFRFYDEKIITTWYINKKDEYISTVKELINKMKSGIFNDLWKIHKSRIKFNLSFFPNPTYETEINIETDHFLSAIEKCQNIDTIRYNIYTYDYDPESYWTLDCFNPIMKEHKDNVNRTMIIKNKRKMFVDKTTKRYLWMIHDFLTWESETFEIFDRYLHIDQDFIDIGAWIGTTCIYASLLSRNVVAIEPDPVALEDLRKNILANNTKNIQVISRPIDSTEKIVFFGPRLPNEPWNCSTSQIKICRTNSNDIELTTIPISSILSMSSSISLIKVDIESGEELFIPELFTLTQQHHTHPPIYLSFHYSWWKNPDLQRFDSYFKSYKYIYKNTELIELSNLYHLIEKEPFIALVFTDMLIG